MLAFQLIPIHFDRETRCMLYLARVAPELSVLGQAQSLTNEHFDWDRFVSLSTGYGTAAMVYRNLLRLPGAPPTILDRFRNIYNNLVRSNVLMISEVDRLMDLLNGQGIEVITLKGAVASEEIFGDIGAYPSDDIDFLVKVEEIDKVRVILEADGYRLNDIGFDEHRDFFMKELYHISLSNGRFTVEPHWNLFIRYFNTPPEFWWGDSLTYCSGGRQYRSLSPEKYVLYTSFRLFLKGFGNLRFLVMIAAIIRHYRGGIHWNALLDHAARYKFENALRLALRLSVNLFGAPVPARYSELKNIRSRILYRHALRMLFTENLIVHPFHKTLFAFLRDDLAGPFRVLSRRLFPDVGEIVARYRLAPGSRKIVLYWILNPFLLMLRRHQK